MLRSNSRSLGNHVVSPKEEKERLQWEGFAEKEGMTFDLNAWDADSPRCFLGEVRWRVGRRWSVTRRLSCLPCCVDHRGSTGNET